MDEKTETIPVVPAIVPAEPTAIPAEPVIPPVEVDETIDATGEPDWLLSSVLDGLKTEPDPVPEAVPVAEPVVEPVVEPVEPPPVVAPPAAPAVPVKKTVKSAAKGNPLVDDPAPYQPPAVIPAPPVATAHNFTADQVEELAEAQVAERLFGDRYRGKSAALAKWYEGFDARAEALRKSNPDINEDDAEWQALLASKPTIDKADQRRVLKKIAAEEAVKEVTPKLDELAMETKKVSIMPGVTAFATQTFPAHIRSLIAADPNSSLGGALKLVQEKGAEAAAAEFPMEFQIMKEVGLASQARVSEFLLLRNKAAKFDERNPRHAEIRDYINKEGDDFARKGGKMLNQDGRQFLTRNQFIALVNTNAEEAGTFDAANWRTSKYWTFTDSTIVDMMAYSTKKTAENLIAQKQAEVKSYGYERPAKAQSAIPKTQPTEVKPPQARTTVAPGAAQPPKTVVSADDSPIPLSSLVAGLTMKK